MEDNNPTVRRYPRTMNEAFPQDAAHWFEGPPKVELSIGDVVLLTLSFAMLLWVLAVWLRLP